MNHLRPFRQLKLKKRVKIGLFLIALGCLVLILSLDNGIRPILIQHAQAKAKTYANTVLNQTIQTILKEQNVIYEQIVRIVRQEDNSISSVEIDSIQVNALKSRIIGCVQKEISSGPTVAVAIPLGTLSGSEYFLGRGPELHFSLKISATVTAGLKSHFVSAGINQTLHRITMPITTKLYLMMPLYRTGCEVVNDFLIAETVIVGKIPDAYTNVVETPSDDIAGVLFDYSAETS